MNQRGTLESATVVVVARILTSLVTLALGILSASYFGTSAEKDCYLVAQGIPSFVTLVLIGGIYTSLVLALADVGQKGGVAAQRRFATKTLLRLLGALVPSALLVAFVARPLVHVIAPGFPPERIELTSWLLRVSLLGSLGGFVLVVARGLFQTRSRFIESGAANILSGLVSLAALFALTSRLGIFSLAWGSALGIWSAAAFLAILAFVRLQDPPGFVAQPAGPSEDASHHRFLWSAFLPMSLGTTFGQMNVLIDNAFASYLPAGNITVLGFANVIISNVVVLTAWPIAEVSFPRMVAASNRGDSALIEEFRSSQRYMLLLMAPIAAGIVSFGSPMARMIFERRAFGAESTHAVGMTLAWYGLEILLMGPVLLLSRILFARRKLRLIAATAIAAIVLNTALDAVLVRFLGVYGIALATSGVTLACFILLHILIRRDLGAIIRAGDGAYTAKILGSAGLVAITAWTWASVFEHYADVSSEMFRIVEVSVGIGLGASVYLGALHLAGVREGTDLVRRFRSMLLGGFSINP